MSGLVHSADAPDELRGLQQCERCGVILIDHRGIDAPTDANGKRVMFWWGPSARVLIEGSSSMLQPWETAPTCKVQPRAQVIDLAEALRKSLKKEDSR